jgi:hypothetical protein
MEGTVGDDPEQEGVSQSIVIPFRHRDEDGPKAIVIGGAHAPYYLFDDGHTELASPATTPDRIGDG